MSQIINIFSKNMEIEYIFFNYNIKIVKSHYIFKIFFNSEQSPM